MSNYTSRLLAIYKELDQIAQENNKTVLDIKKDFDVIFIDKLALQIAKDFKKTGVATQVYRKYGISQKYFRKLLAKVHKHVPKKHRPVKEFVYTTLEQYNISYQEYVKIAQYFEKHELDADKALLKLQKLRNTKPA